MISVMIRTNAPAGETLFNCTHIENDRQETDLTNNDDCDQTFIGTLANVFIEKDGPTFVQPFPINTYILHLWQRRQRPRAERGRYRYLTGRCHVRKRNPVAGDDQRARDRLGFRDPGSRLHEQYYRKFRGDQLRPHRQQFGQLGGNYHRHQ